MKIGIVTVHNGRNYGASLQVYALITKLREMGHEAFLIDYRNSKIENRISSYTDKAKYNSVKNAIKNLKLVASDLMFKSSAHVELVAKQFDEFHKKILYDNKKVYFTSEDMRELNSWFDAFICGSDQIWNPTITGLDEAFFLDFADNTSKRIAYAPSLGMKSEAIDSATRTILKENLRRIQYLSIREENNKELIEQLTGRKCQIVVDPVLLLTKDRWKEALDSSNDVCPNQPYAFYYPVVEQPELEKFAMQESKRRGWKLVNPRLVPKYAKLKGYTEVAKSIVGPAEFLKLLVNSEAVFTNSFHATVFSSVFEKELYIIPLRGKHSTRNNRIFQYLNKIEILDCNLNEDCDAIHIESKKFRHVENILSNEKNKSVEFLMSALS